MKDLDDYDAPGLERGSVVVVDEAGMVGTRQLDALLNHAEEAGAKMVLVGDDKQLPEIAAGGAFRALKEQLAAIELSEVRRQRDSWRDALELLREGLPLRPCSRIMDQTGSPMWASVRHELIGRLRSLWSARVGSYRIL
jgi:ATP-dependent exoDNAse (exonuclease V) alpha subunit